MPRIQPPARLPVIARLMDQAIRWRYGRPFPSVRLLAHNPTYLLGYAALSSATTLGRTALNSEIKTLVSLLVAGMNGCAFCIDLGRRTAQDTRMNVEKMMHVLEFATRPDLYTPREMAAMQYAQEATQLGARVSDETFAALKAHFSDREIMELTVTVATENFYNRLSIPLEIESQGLCALAQR